MNGVRFVGIVGSLRVGSVNAAAARAALTLVPDDVAMAVHDVQALPLYHGDEEAEGPPIQVIALRDAVRDADGIVLFSPEYNGSLPAVTKNVIDWLSRDAEVWSGKGITMMSMSPGGRAAAGAREHFEAIMPRQATRLFPTIGFGRYGERLDAAGEVADEATLEEIRRFLTEFAAFCASPDGDG